MTGTSQDDLRPNWHVRSGEYAPSGQQSRWVTWLVFAGVMLAIVGFLQALAGLTALFDEDSFAVPSTGLVVGVSYDVWGWTHLVLGAVAMVTAFLLLRGNLFGRILGVVIAVCSALLNLAFLPTHPWWSVLVIAFDVLVVHAITVHGGELKGTA
ncbi:hypothetical protein ACI8AF_15235 [Blastococcus sp. SYSU D00669]